MPGADKVSIMTAAVKNPDLVAEAANKIGSANLVVAIDAKAMEHDAPTARRPRHGRSAPTAAAGPPASTRSSGRGAWPMPGAGEILLTSMDRDGTKSGYDLAMLRAVCRPRLGAGRRVGRRRQARRSRRGAR